MTLMEYYGLFDSKVSYEQLIYLGPLCRKVKC